MMREGATLDDLPRWIPLAGNFCFRLRLPIRVAQVPRLPYTVKLFLLPSSCLLIRFIQKDAFNEERV